MKPSARRRKNGGYGSQTNASDAIDDIALPSHPSGEELLDAGVQETFPASDPIAVQEAYWRSDGRQGSAVAGGTRREARLIRS
jgi:hypothetical protein